MSDLREERLKNFDQKQYYTDVFAEEIQQLRKRLNDQKEDDISDDERQEIEAQLKKNEENLGNIDHYLQHRFDNMDFDYTEREEKEWKENYAEKCKVYCEQTLKIAKRYIKKHGKTQVEKIDDYVSCVRCERFFPLQYRLDDHEAGYCCSTDVRYDEKQNLWYMLGGFGSITNDNNSCFVIMEPAKFPNLEMGKNLCDECVSVLCAEGILRFVGEMYCITDYELWNQVQAACDNYRAQ
jgi:hypothetical protein